MSPAVSSATFTYATPPTDGDVLFLHVMVTLGKTVTTPAGWTLVLSYGDTGAPGPINNWKSYYFTRVASATTTVSLVFSGSTCWAAHSLVFRSTRSPSILTAHITSHLSEASFDVAGDWWTDGTPVTLTSVPHTVASGGLGGYESGAFLQIYVAVGESGLNARGDDISMAGTDPEWVEVLSTGEFYGSGAVIGGGAASGSYVTSLAMGYLLTENDELNTVFSAQTYHGGDLDWDMYLVRLAIPLELGPNLSRIYSPHYNERRSLSSSQLPYDLRDISTERKRR